MWFKFAVIGVSHDAAAAAAQQHKQRRVARCFCKFDSGNVPARFGVADSHLAAFGVPLGVDAVKPRDRLAPEHYTFSLTASDGCRAHGFCRRTLPPPPPDTSPSSRSGSNKPGSSSHTQQQQQPHPPPARLPVVLVLVAEAPWAAVFFRALEAVEQLLFGSSGGALGGGPAAGQQLLDAATGPELLPVDSRAAQLLAALAKELAFSVPPLGSTIRLAVPPLAAIQKQQQQQQQQGEVLELQVPRDSGTGAANAGVALARLVWHLPVPALASLIACLLCERRVVLVSESLDVVTHAAAAAAALLHPLSWQHVLLMLLPAALTDYLSAPVPFLAGVHASLLPAVRSEAAGRLAVFDLDLGTFECSSGGSGFDDEPGGLTGDCAARLPWRPALEAALAAARATLRSPTEQEANALIAAVVQGYYVKLFGGYRPFICRDAPADAAAVAMRPPLPPRASTPPLLQLGGGQPAAAKPPPPPSPSLLRRPLARSSAPARSGAGSSSNRPPCAIAGGPGPAASYYLDHAAFAAAAHRRRPAARAFLAALRGSQLYEAFVRGRLAIAAACGYAARGGASAASTAAAVQRRWDAGGDEFEALIDRHVAARRARRLARKLAATASLSPLAHLQQQQRRRRTDADCSGASGAANQQAAAALVTRFAAAARGADGGGGGSIANIGARGGMASRSHGDLQALLAAGRAADSPSLSFDGAALPVASSASFTAGCSSGLRGGTIGGRPRSSSAAAAVPLPADFDPAALFEDSADDDSDGDGDEGVSGSRGGGAGGGGILSGATRRLSAAAPSQRGSGSSTAEVVGRSASAADLRQLSGGTNGCSGGVIGPLAEEEGSPKTVPALQQEQQQLQLPKPPAPRFSLRQPPTASAAALPPPSAAAGRGTPLSRMFGGALKSAAKEGGGGGVGGRGADPFAWLAALRKPAARDEGMQQLQLQQHEEGDQEDAFAALAARHV